MDSNMANQIQNLKKAAAANKNKSKSQMKNYNQVDGGKYGSYKTNDSTKNNNRDFSNARASGANTAMDSNPQAISNFKNTSSQQRLNPSHTQQTNLYQSNPNPSSSQNKKQVGVLYSNEKQRTHQQPYKHMSNFIDDKIKMQDYSNVGSRVINSDGKFVEQNQFMNTKKSRTEHQTQNSSGKHFSRTSLDNNYQNVQGQTQEIKGQKQNNKMRYSSNFGAKNQNVLSYLNNRVQQSTDISPNNPGQKMNGALMTNGGNQNIALPNQRKSKSTGRQPTNVNSGQYQQQQQNTVKRNNHQNSNNQIQSNKFVQNPGQIIEQQMRQSRYASQNQIMPENELISRQGMMMQKQSNSNLRPKQNGNQSDIYKVYLNYVPQESMDSATRENINQQYIQNQVAQIPQKQASQTSANSKTNVPVMKNRQQNSQIVTKVSKVSKGEQSQGELPLINNSNQNTLKKLNQKISKENLQNSSIQHFNNQGGGTGGNNYNQQQLGTYSQNSQFLHSSVGTAIPNYKGSVQQSVQQSTAIYKTNTIDQHGMTNIGGSVIGETGGALGQHHYRNHVSNQSANIGMHRMNLMNYSILQSELEQETASLEDMHIFFVAFNHRQNQLLQGLESKQIEKEMNVVDNLRPDADLVNVGQTKEEIIDEENLNVIILKNEIDLE